MAYSIILNDGTKLTNLEVNGNNFVSVNKIDESIFENNLSVVTISNGETEWTYNDLVFIQQQKIGDKWYLALTEKTPQEKIAELITTNSDNVTDLQLALAEIYELMLGGV